MDKGLVQNRYPNRGGMGDIVGVAERGRMFIKTSDQTAERDQNIILNGVNSLTSARL